MKYDDNFIYVIILSLCCNVSCHSDTSTSNAVASENKYLLVFISIISIGIISYSNSDATSISTTAGTMTYSVVLLYSI